MPQGSPPSQIFRGISPCHHRLIPITISRTKKRMPQSGDSPFTRCVELTMARDCVGSGGGDVSTTMLSNVKRHSSGHSNDHVHHNEVEESAKEGCHFHAGVEHCAGASKPANPCARRDRKYSIPLRIGATFAILVTSSIAVFGPILLKQLTKVSVTSLAFTLIKQFGAGVIVATAFLHLLTHAQLLFGSECIGSLKYEGTATAITMAGVFLAFLMEYLGARFISRRNSRGTTAGGAPSIKGVKEIGHPLGEPSGQPCIPLDTVAQDRLSVGVMESGIIFHSICKNTGHFFLFPSAAVIDIVHSNRCHFGGCRGLWIHISLHRYYLPSSVRGPGPWRSNRLPPRANTNAHEAGYGRRFRSYHAPWYGHRNRRAKQIQRKRQNDANYSWNS